MGRKRRFSKLLLFAVMLSTIGAGVLGSIPLPVKAAEEGDDTVTYEARIGDASYEKLEEAFANAQAGDTITVLKDCSVSATLEAVADNITLQSGDSGNPAVISREAEFTGKNYHRTDMDDVLLEIEGSLTLRNIILDGGAELDADFNNVGQAWGGPLVYVTGTCTVEDGTVLQNNYNMDYNEDNRSSRSAGAAHVEWGGTFTMTGGLIHSCYTSGAGGGIQTGRTSSVTVTGGEIRNCGAFAGAAAAFYGPASVSGMTISGNKALAAIVTLHGEDTLSGCLIEGNEVTGDAGTVSVSENFPVVIEGCTITGNHNQYTSAIGYSGKDRTEPLTVRDCTIRGNTAEHPYSGTTINYMTKADLVLDGEIVIEDNTVAGGKAWDIRFYYQDATPVTLGADFESGSTFVLWGRDFTPGTLLVDAATNEKEADASQFLWKTDDYRTEGKDGNIYLAEVPETYFIAYDANNKDEGLAKSYTDPTLYTSEDTVTVLDRDGVYPYMGSLEKAGYNFTGWNTKKDGTGTDYVGGEEIHLTENTYLYAKWEAKEPVTITFIYNDGKIGTDSTKAVYGSELTFPDASRKGYDFMGWYEDEELIVLAGNGGDTYTVPQEDTSYYAAWEKAEATVTFNADGGEMQGGSITAKIGEAITLPECTKGNLIFTGWYDGDTCVGQAGEDYTVADDITLKAHYEEKEAAVCTITFDADGGKMQGGTITAKEGDTIILPLCTKEDFTFTGRYDGDALTGKAGEEYTVLADVTLKARYEKEKEEEKSVICTVTFDADGGETVRKSISAEKGSAVILPLCSKTGYEFLGWFLASDENVCAGQAGEEFTVQSDITLKAHFEKKEAVKVTITFDTDGGKAVKPIKAAKGDVICLPKTEKEGYSFLGWYTEKDGGILLGIPGSEMKAAKDMTAYALWEKEAVKDDGNGKDDADPETCKVRFYAGKGTIKVEELTIIKDGSLYLPLPERKGYDFTGWYLDDNLTQFAGAYHDTYCITKDTDFYAKWEEAKDNSDSGDSGSSGDLGNSENTGDNDGNGGGNGNGSGTGNGDGTQDGDNNSGETLNTYTIKYDANGGKTKNASVKVVKGGSVKLPGGGREGYIFKGWYTDRQVFIGTEGEAYKPGRSISLYARWEKAEKDGQENQDSNSSGNTNGNDDKNASDKNKDTNGTVSGNTAGGSSDKNKDTNTATKTEGGNGNDGKGSEPVIQTGYVSPFILLAALGLCGVVLIGASVLEAKKDGKSSL